MHKNVKLVLLGDGYLCGDQEVFFFPVYVLMFIAAGSYIGKI